MVSIKSLRLKGFKSFKHANILFNHKFTSIAGPNGSGKSNIIDGIRFAFGETSMKSLRIKNIAGLVNHSSREAAVTLVVDTGDGKEIEFKRIITPNGKAKYKVNGKTVKRYAMIDTLRKYNLSLGEHNVIAQGMVQKFVEMNPKERRMIIDDVSGIAEYDQKKNEAVRELNEVQRRIDDANIVLSERDGYLKELEKEKDDALKYKEAENMYKRAKGSLLYIQMNKTEKQLEKLMKRYVDLKKKKDEYKKDIALLENRIKELSSKKEEIVNKINEDSEQKQHMKTLEQIHVQINVDKQKIISLEADIENIKKDAHALNDEINKTQMRFDNISKQLWKSEKELKEIQVKLKMFGKIEEDNTISTYEMQLENYMKKEKQLIESLGRLEAEVNGYKELLSAYSGQMGGNDLEKMKDEKDTLHRDIKSLEKDIERLFQKEKQMNRELPELDRRLLDLKEKIASLRPFIGKSINPAMPFIENLKTQIKGIHGPVIDLIEFNDEYSDAITAAGGGRLNYIVVDNVDVAAKIIKQLKTKGVGRATFIPLDKIVAKPVVKTDKGMGNITKYVHSAPEYDKVIQFVFGNTILVKDVAEAKKYINKYRMVTLTGELFELSGVITGGKSSKLSAKRKYDSYNKELEEVKQQRELIYSTLSEIRDKMSTKRRERAQLEVRLRSVETELNMYKAEDYTDKINDVKNKIKIKNQELNDNKRELTIVREKINELKKQIGDKAEKLKKKRSAIDKQRETLNEKITELKTNIASMKKEKNMLSENLNTLKNRQDKINQDIENKATEIENTKKRIVKNEKKEKELSVKVKTISKKMESLWSELRELDNMLNELSTQKGNIERKMERTIGELNGFEVQKVSLETRLGDLKGEYEEFNKYPLIDAGENRLQEIMEMYENTLNQLGNVNLRAPEIYEEKKKEMDEIRERITRLEDEKKAVYRMIDEIEQRKRDVFIEVFNGINDKFKEMYSNLMHGEAVLILDDYNNPFNSGLRIKVTYNGKETYIDSMSGGERTVLSIILILAIQMIRPSPFYLMDEVDAALDKENSKLLARLIKNMSKNSQFIVVSHNDEVLKSADAVLGVSRDNNGNSKVVGIKLTMKAEAKAVVKKK
ncbi:chromosome segregation protein SMC [Candidatus Micrarchaeota archaeon]|nr:chromosome segregation protein SMC [Candidatus Micrarchaeota archaeon]